jgi:hypothetical protein
VLLCLSVCSLCGISSFFSLIFLYLCVCVCLSLCHTSASSSSSVCASASSYLYGILSNVSIRLLFIINMGVCLGKLFLLLYIGVLEDAKVFFSFSFDQNSLSLSLYLWQIKIYVCVCVCVLCWVNVFFTVFTLPLSLCLSTVLARVSTLRMYTCYLSLSLCV